MGGYLDCYRNYQACNIRGLRGLLKIIPEFHAIWSVPFIYARLAFCLGEYDCVDTSFLLN